ncbi:MAG: ABC transporter ATP-binding protein/permease [Aestuariivirga sp.]|uniref:ABC transporter ATP-binding protein/permease n=1 Tax=Aestuariivirga sp. TaxID=2650926 RepID=UPI0025BD8FFA|nr:ABC transporter ATP-binding protein/permease [Aestuariivirga sp.]MCA3562227.1 ABC transporter ATP-binding protein/permease [Aestuariivirga sp.]
MNEPATGQGLGGQLGGMVALLRASRCGGRILLLMAALVAVIAATAWYQILLNAWNKPFYDSLTHKDFAGFLHQLRVFAGLALVLLALNVGQLWLDQTLKLTLRRGLLGALLGQWMKPGRADAIARSGSIGENPDQRMQIDADNLADLTAALGIGLFQSTLLLVSFIGVLWGQSGTVSIPVAGHSYEIHGFMVWCALLYAGAASWLSWRVGRRLVGLNAERSAREASFRFELVRVNESRDNIAIHHGEAAELQRIGATFGHVVDVIRAAIRATVGLTWVTAGFGWFALVAPIVAASPFYFAGSMTIGELMLIVGAFNQVQSALRWYVNNVPAIANWRATLGRVTSFHHALAALDNAAVTGAPRIARREEGNSAAFSGLRVMTPYLCVSLAEDPVVAGPGERLLLHGLSGSGKTLLFRAIAGLWAIGEGRIVMPAQGRALYMPTEAYVPPGPLIDAVCYPHPPGDYAPGEVAAALDAVGLGHLVAGLSVSGRWDQSLNASERQSIAFARAMLQKPDWLVMDDALAQIDPEAQGKIVALLRGPLAHAGLLGIGNGMGSESDGLYQRSVAIVSEPGVPVPPFSGRAPAVVADAQPA